MSYNYVHSTLDVRVGRGALDIALPLRVLYTYDSHSATIVKTQTPSSSY
jgi:hypothetical protein